MEVLTVSVNSRFSHKIWQEKELSEMEEGGAPLPGVFRSGRHNRTRLGILIRAINRTNADCARTLHNLHEMWQ
jgi:hypothetical protein